MTRDLAKRVLSKISQLVKSLEREHMQ